MSNQTTDPALAAIAARLDLRDPNFLAVETLSIKSDNHFEQGGEAPYECVLDSATGVGKTYILAAGIEYWAARGARNHAVIVPRKAILKKTVNNFLRGHAQSVMDGMEIDPVIITAENFDSPSMRAAMEDPDQVKIFIFTVQALLKPTSETGRRTHSFREGLGGGFYEHLTGLDDLIVWADEHHCYYGPAFSQAVRGLGPRMIVGLTATPHSSTPPEQIIFRYPLSLAIAEKLVKTPVLVGRKDDRSDDETKLRDGLRLLDAKAAAAERYREDQAERGLSVRRWNPQMLVIAKDIPSAESYERLLTDETFMEGRWGKHTLVVHSGKPEEALQALDTAEDPDSPVRIIISVGMLREGWSNRSVTVIAAMRALVSDILTEQTLGRGLRLPYGAYSGWEILDTLEVLAHEKYDQLLKRANAISEEFVDYRTQIVTKTNAQGKQVRVVETVRVDLTLTAPGETNGGATGGQSGTGAAGGSDRGATGDGGRPGLTLEALDERSAEVEGEVEAVQKTIRPNPDAPRLLVPALKMSTVRSDFSLADITEHDEFTKLGRKLASTPPSELRRRLLSVQTAGTKTQEVTTEEAVDAIESAGQVLFEKDARDQLIASVRQAGVVPGRPGQARALDPIIDAFIEGLGNEWNVTLSAYMQRAVEGVSRLLAAEKKKVASQPKYEEYVTLHEIGRDRVGRPKVTRDLSGKYKARYGYEGWKKSLYPQEWFDSSTERDMAFLLDTTVDIEFWARLQNGDLPILWTNEGQQYNPDLIAVDGNAHRWLIEAKADRDMTIEAVLGKRKAAKRWVQHVNADDKTEDTWHYVLASETDLKTAKGDWDALRRIAEA